MEEFQQAVEERGALESYWVVHIKSHKTNGPAQLIIPAHLKPLYDRYYELRRGKGTSNLFFVNSLGRQPSKLPAVVKCFAKQYNVELPALTTHRKVIATKASALSEQQQEQVASL